MAPAVLNIERSLIVMVTWYTRGDLDSGGTKVANDVLIVAPSGRIRAHWVWFCTSLENIDEAFNSS